MQIAVAGIQHETNTFSSITTDWAAFKASDNWPALAVGNEILSNLTNSNIPISGFINQALKDGHDIIPLLWCSATPAGKVSCNAFKKYCDMLLQQIQKQSFDILYLDLHGAMVTDYFDDADGELLQLLRQKIPGNIKIIASVDLHANISDKMLNNSNLILAYRTYPHIDMAEIGAKLATKVKNLQLYTAHKKINFLINMPAQSTLTSPAKHIFENLKYLENKYSASISFCMGFPLADTEHTGPSVFAYAQHRWQAEAAVEELSELIYLMQHKFKCKLLSAQAALQNYKKIKPANAPIIFADTEDNPGCGGAGNTTTILNHLLDQKIERAVVAMLYDPQTAAQAHKAGINSTISVELGADKLKLTLKVKNISNGNFTCNGAFYNGCQMQLGPCAQLECGAIQIVVCSQNVQAADRAMLEHLGIDIQSTRLLVLKSSVHFRADFAELSSKIFLVAAGGLNISRLNELKYIKLPPDMEIPDATTAPA